MLSRECGLLGASVDVRELVFVMWDHSVYSKTYLLYGIILCYVVCQCVTEHVLSFGSLSWVIIFVWGEFVLQGMAMNHRVCLSIVWGKSVYHEACL